MNDIPEMPIELEITNIPPYKPKKMEFGKVTVCDGCGNAIFGNPTNPKPTCCGELMPLKRYVEEIRGEKFEEEKWGWEEETIYAMSDETKNLIKKERQNDN